MKYVTAYTAVTDTRSSSESMREANTLLAGASTSLLLLRVGLARSRLQVDIHHVLLLCWQCLHSWQGCSDLAEQRLHTYEEELIRFKCAQHGTSKSLSIYIVVSLETNGVLDIWIWPWCWSRLSRWSRWTWHSILLPCSLLLLWTLVCVEQGEMITSLQASSSTICIFLWI